MRDARIELTCKDVELYLEDAEKLLAKKYGAEFSDRRIGDVVQLAHV